jgi:hypothetical protein
MDKDKHSKEYKDFAKKPEKDNISRRNLEELLKKLGAVGKDPHGELEWGEDVGNERF